MAITATLVRVGHNRLRYLISATNTESPQTVTITTTGGATPDLLTDSVRGPIKNMAKAFAQGYGKLAAGALTQAQARAVWLSDNAGADIGNKKIVRGLCKLQPRDGPMIDAAVDANVDGGGHPTINVTVGAGAADLYLDVTTNGTIGA